MSNMDYSKINDVIKVATQGKGIKGFASKLTYAIIIVSFLVGIIGSFGLWGFDMDAYVKFLPAIGFLVVPLIISIGTNSAVTKIKNGETEKAAAVAHEMKKENEEAVGWILN